MLEVPAQADPWRSLCGAVAHHLRFSILVFQSRRQRNRSCSQSPRATCNTCLALPKARCIIVECAVPKFRLATIGATGWHGDIETYNIRDRTNRSVTLMYIYLRKKQFWLLCNQNIGRQPVDLEFNVFLCSWIVLLYGSGYALLHYHNVFNMSVKLCASVHQYTYIVV